ncbi:hypothetical protein [Paraburkholderia ferrariae]|uniref:hypothetical protein n=1 Tax=Paraburkholderia ferrariae TaxID=386056 RepID=UPI001FDFC9C2|nr:hypothetical protein [Paraburkholderia ferrariae]
MKLVSQSEFARMCGVSRQAVLKWKAAGSLVLQGTQVDVDATDEYMQRYHKGGSPLRRQPVDTIGAVDSQLTTRGAVDRTPENFATVRRLSDLDGTVSFDFSHDGQRRRVGGAARSLGFELRFQGDDIELWRNGQPHFVSVGDGFEVNAYCALEMLRWWLDEDPIVEDSDDPMTLLARPFGTSETTDICCNDSPSFASQPE